MTDKMGIIKIYEPSMAKAAAEMFNAFNELWPGGFGGGIPYSKQRVQDWLDKTSAYADLIAIDEEGTLAGYCGLYPHWRDKKAAYISILGVTPKAKGKKFGKRLLLKALEIALENGLTRVDLHTWSGNLEAMPLYKKIGLFWVPDTEVYMQDFIPGILQLPLAKDYFAKHPDWYSSFKRELTQAPDENVVENMELYSYVFENGDDRFEAEIDRYGWGFCGFERTLDGKKISIKTRMKSHKIFIGIPNAMTIRIRNENGQDVKVKLNVEAFDGLTWKEPFPKSFELKKGEVLDISREFTVDNTTTVFKDNSRSCEIIKSTISFEDSSIELVTSGKIQSAIDLRSINENRFMFVPIGKESVISMDLINHTDLELKGTINIKIPGLKNSNQIFDYAIKPNDISGIQVPVTFPRNQKNKLTIEATPSITYNNKKEEMPCFYHPIIAKKNNVVELLEFKDTKTLFLVTDKVTVRANLEGGNIRVSQQDNQGTVPINHQAGPPFGISLDGTLLHTYELQQDGFYTTLVLSAESIQVLGLHVKKYLRVAPGLDEVEYWVEYTNRLQNGSIHVCGRTSTGRGGISLSPMTAKGKSFTPIKGKIIECDSVAEFLTSPLITENAKDWHETWTATEGLIYKDLTTWIWKPDNIEKVKANKGSLSRLDSVTKEVNPGEIYKPAHLWYCFGMVSLQEVRNRWNQLVGNTQFNFQEDFLGPKTIKLIETEIADGNIVQSGQTHLKTITMTFVSSYPLQGALTIKAPKGWQVKFLLEKERKETIQLPKYEPFVPLPIQIEIVVPENTKTSVEKLQLHLSSEFELDFDLPVLVASADVVKIAESAIGERKTYEVSNASLSFVIPKDIGGNLLRLKDAKGKTFLIDNFPELQPRFFFTHNIGGMQPAVIHFAGDNPFHKPEVTTTKIVEDGLWKGVKSSWTITNDKEYLKGLGVETTYLTLPGSDIIRVIMTLDNKTSRKLPCGSGLMVDLGLDGSRENNVIEATGGSGLWTRNPVKKQFMANSSFEEPYCRVTKGKQSLAIVIPDGYPGSAISVDLVMMLLNWIINYTYVEPNAKTTTEMVIMINQPREKMEEVRIALGKK